MGHIEELRKNILDMTHEESMDRIRRIREERRVNRSPEKERKARSQRKAGQAKLIAGLKGLTPAQLKELASVLKRK